MSEQTKRKRGSAASQGLGKETHSAVSGSKNRKDKIESAAKLAADFEKKKETAQKLQQWQERILSKIGAGAAAANATTAGKKRSNLSRPSDLVVDGSHDEDTSIAPTKPSTSLNKRQKLISGKPSRQTDDLDEQSEEVVSDSDDGGLDVSFEDPEVGGSEAADGEEASDAEGEDEEEQGESKTPELSASAERRKRKKKKKNDAPQEISAKKRPPPFKPAIPVGGFKARDPRFDDLSGDFHEHHFKQHYSFLSEVKQNELKELEATLKKTRDAERRQDIQRVINKYREEMRLEEKRARDQQLKSGWRKQAMDQAEQGKKPYFVKKGEAKQLSLVAQYKELQSSGKLDKFMAKRRKKLAGKDGRLLPAQE